MPNHRKKYEKKGIKLEKTRAMMTSALIAAVVAAVVAYTAGFLTGARPPSVTPGPSNWEAPVSAEALPTGGGRVGLIFSLSDSPHSIPNRVPDPSPWEPENLPLYESAPGAPGPVPPDQTRQEPDRLQLYEKVPVTPRVVSINDYNSTPAGEIARAPAQSRPEDTPSRKRVSGDGWQQLIRKGPL
jgi:hypothetical protein